MTDSPATPPKPPEDDRELARRKLIGRSVVIGFLGLIALYVAVTFWPR